MINKSIQSQHNQEDNLGIQLREQFSNYIKNQQFFLTRVSLQDDEVLGLKVKGFWLSSVYSLWQ